AVSVVIGGDPSPPPPQPPFSLSDPLLVDVAPGASLNLTTTEDILVLDFAPADRDSIRLRGKFIDFALPSDFTLDLSGLAATECDGEDCVATPLALSRDVVVRFAASYSAVDLRAGGELLYLTPLAGTPEPDALALLVALGALARPHLRRRPA